MFHLDRHARRVQVGPIVVALTELETLALARLDDHRGQPVTRKVLEREVWGLAAGVRSEAVPVAMRRLRAKLSKANCDLLESVRGVGWRLAPDAVVSTAQVPRFGTPYQPRPALQQQLQDVRDAGWRVVTLVGPGGAGKSRLAAHVAGAHPGEVLWLPMGGARTADEVFAWLRLRAGVEATTAQGLDQTLAARHDLVVVLDEAEEALDATRDTVQALPSLSFLVTSRVELGRADEARVAVPGLQTEDATRFLRARMLAARWTQLPDAATLSALVGALDGLPLPLETVAARPCDPRDLLEDLAQSPGTASTDRLLAPFRPTWRRLTAGAKDLLVALSVSEVPLTADEIVDWLPEHAGALDELLRGSTLVWVDQGYTVPRLLRALAASEAPDFDRTARPGFDQWLARRVVALGRDQPSRPRRAARWLARWLPAVTGLLVRLPARDVPAVLDGLFRCLLMSGPLGVASDLARVAYARCPHDPLVSVLAQLAHARPDLAVLERAEAGDDPVAVWWATRLRGWFGTTRDPELFRRHARRLPEPDRLLWAGLMIEDPSTPAEARLAQARDLAERGASWPGVHPLLLRRLARALERDGFDDEALAVLRAAAQQLRHSGMDMSEVVILRSLAELTSAHDLEAARRAYLDLAQRAQRTGVERLLQVSRGSAGLIAYATGRLDEAPELLRAGVGASPRTDRWYAWGLRAVEVRAGRAHDFDGLPSLPQGPDDPEAMIEVLFRAELAFRPSASDSQRTAAREALEHRMQGQHPRLARLLWRGLIGRSRRPTC